MSYSCVCEPCKQGTLHKQRHNSYTQAHHVRGSTRGIRRGFPQQTNCLPCGQKSGEGKLVLYTDRATTRSCSCLDAAKPRPEVDLQPVQRPAASRIRQARRLTDLTSKQYWERQKANEAGSVFIMQKKATVQEAIAAESQVVVIASLLSHNLQPYVMVNLPKTKQLNA